MMHFANTFLDQQSKSQNPYLFRGFFGFAIPPGTHACIVHLFGNKSTTYPEGSIDANTLKSFYAMTGTDGNSLTYTPGGERIYARHSNTRTRTRIQHEAKILMVFMGRKSPTMLYVLRGAQLSARPRTTTGDSALFPQRLHGWLCKALTE